MEELLNHPMISMTLSPTFNQEEWKLITQQKPSLYQTHLQALYRMLQNNLPCLAAQYYKFLQNMGTLTQWHHQNPRLQYQIQKYLYVPHRREDREKMIQTSSVPKRSEAKRVKKFFAQTINLPPSHQSMEIQPVDSYGLYMQTLSACRGKHYAAYDYQKHMKNSQQTKKYNDFIRTNHKKHFTNLNQKRQNSLQSFQEWHLNHYKKTSLINVRKILSDLSLNNEKGINQMLKRQGANKLVLLNHQRKPINYYLRIKNRQSQAIDI